MNSMPTRLYSEDMNQSLLAAILRFIGWTVGNGSPYRQPLFIISAFFLAVATLFVSIKAKERYEPLIFALLIPFSLLIYPRTLQHYAVLLILPLMLIWANQRLLLLRTGVVIIIACVVYAILNFSFQAVFIANLILWLILFAILILSMVGGLKSQAKDGRNTNSGQTPSLSPS